MSARLCVIQFGSCCTSVITNYVIEISVAQLGSTCTSVITNYVSEIKFCSIRILLHLCDYQLRQRDIVLLNSDHLALLCLPITAVRLSIVQSGSSCTSVITNYLSEI